MKDVTLGGERLGSGNKQKISLHGYGRSTHNLSEVFRSTMSAGTLVPFLNIVGLPGDTIEIKLDADIKTHPTIGPLFGSYKVQFDVFLVPVRLYQGQLQMNLLNIGNKVSELKLPQVVLKGKQLDPTKEMTGQQVNPSALFSYLGVRGLGTDIDNNDEVQRQVNAIPFLGYWDIYKNYYSNKQEEVGYVIHHKPSPLTIVAGPLQLKGVAPPEGGVVYNKNVSEDPAQTNEMILMSPSVTGEFPFSPSTEQFDPERMKLWYQIEGVGPAYVPITEIFEEIVWNESTNTYNCSKPFTFGTDGWYQVKVGKVQIDRSFNAVGDVEPQMRQFELSNIDYMRKQLLEHTTQNTAFVITEGEAFPYQGILRNYVNGETRNYSMTGNQEGLGLKTYLSDKYQNWINTEWIDGEGGINEITAISTADGQITIDEINLSTKIYKMLNRIAVSDGSFDSWISAVYDHEPATKITSPIYVGGMFQELVFDEVISNASTEEQALGTLGGRGLLANNRKGGNMTIRVDEHSYIMGIVSLTPRVDYSQGNEWDIDLKTMDDFHKPPLDEIGFQDLITEQMAYWETRVDSENNVVHQRSAGKQPAWTNYMTAVNKTYGNFALENEQMFMTLNRRYSMDGNIDDSGLIIKDLTTYIDPAKFNGTFAHTRRDAQNFWVQIGMDIKARRKMSAKVMPNL